ncbi:N-acetylmuramoyl-L-alanine amidase isoform X3 [Cygnus olor]|uniref:N-acetylmuramoyl-L-alanine amidase isoform X3 n=1 Tax=Cygnus olor TaxID=8869 RepID=UPI001ADE30B2|nr:N-acetylmuramoyl-L-alanine amidase isoform X3 [Cygnus olor]
MLSLWFGCMHPVPRAFAHFWVHLSHFGSICPSLSPFTHLLVPSPRRGCLCSFLGAFTPFHTQCGCNCLISGAFPLFWGLSLPNFGCAPPHICLHPPLPALPPRHMDTVVQIVEALEAAEDLSLLELARALGSCSTPGCRAVLGDPPAAPPAVPALSPEQWALLTQLLHPDPTAPERGMVLAPDGSTVALAPLLTGVEVGLRRAAGWSGAMPKPPAALDALYAVTITEALGTAFLLARAHNHSGAILGPDGCWDDVENPQNFTLLGPPSPVPEAVANGALDGVLLGARLAEAPVPLAPLLRSYYGMDNGTASGRPLSSYRRRDFGVLTGLKKLEEEVVAMLRLLRVLPPTRGLLEDVGEEEEVAIARQAARDFMETYVAPRAAPSPPAPTPCAPCSASTRTPVAGMTLATGETNGTVTLLPSPFAPMWSLSPCHGPHHLTAVPVTPPRFPSPHNGPHHPTVVPITLLRSLSHRHGPRHPTMVPVTLPQSLSPRCSPHHPTPCTLC